MKVQTISVVIPYHGRINFFKSTLDCLNNQTDKDFELIISDDSNDKKSVNGLKSLVKKYPDLNINVIRTKANLGAVANTLQGINHSHNKFVHIL
mgnify:CR=1 FL=1